jgi:DNA-binding transcriptional LysR family regulator
MAMVLADEVQIGFERYLTHPDIETVELYEDDIYLMASADHVFAKRASVTVEEVARESVVFFDVGSSYHAISQAIFRETGVAPRHTLDVDSLEMAKHLVLRSLGLAFLPRVAVELELAAGSVVAMEIEGSEPLRRRITLIYRRRRLQSRAMLALLDLLKEIYHFEYPNPAEQVEREAARI